MHTVRAFRSTAATRGETHHVLNEYLALERARVYRRLFVSRFGLLAMLFVLAGAGLHWLPAVGVSVGVVACTIVPTWAWIAELQCDRRLARRLKALPPDPSSSHAASSVRKS